jgi:hypothetical protein
MFGACGVDWLLFVVSPNCLLLYQSWTNSFLVKAAAQLGKAGGVPVSQFAFSCNSFLHSKLASGVPSSRLGLFAAQVEV